MGEEGSAHLELIAKQREKVLEEVEEDSCGLEVAYNDYENFYDGQETDALDKSAKKWNEMTKAGLWACLVHPITYVRNGG